MPRVPLYSRHQNSNFEPLEFENWDFLLYLGYENNLLQKSLELSLSSLIEKLR